MFTAHTCLVFSDKNSEAIKARRPILLEHSILTYVGLSGHFFFASGGLSIDNRLYIKKKINIGLFSIKKKQ
jgi:hypothetical protein